MLNDNHDATVAALTKFILDNGPEGAERDFLRLREGYTTFPLYVEFRRNEPCNASCCLSVRLDPVGPWEGTFDEEGNRWRRFQVKTEVNWPTYGSSDVVETQHRLALMTEVCRFAAAIQAAFPQEVCHLTQTAADVAERKERAAKERAKQRVVELIKFNAKGMRVGQERRLEANGTDPDFDATLGDFHVIWKRANGGEVKYLAMVTATRAFYFTRVA